MVTPISPPVAAATSTGQTVRLHLFGLREGTLSMLDSAPPPGVPGPRGHFPVISPLPRSAFLLSLWVASGFRCKWAGVVPGFVIRLGDGTDSFAAVGGLAGGDGAWPELGGRVEQGPAQVLQEPEPV